jgi:Ca-activated chloride channel homolog
MRRNWIGYAAIFVLSLGLAADGALAQGSAGLLTGRVVDAATGTPLAGAVVFMRPGGKAARTGGDGRYVIAGVHAGTYAVQCAKSGYASDTARGVAMAAGARVRHDCRLRPLHRQATTGAADKSKAPVRDRAPEADEVPVLSPPPAKPSPRYRSYHHGGHGNARGIGYGAISPSAPAPLAVNQQGRDEGMSREGYETRDENPFVDTRSQPLSTFSIDVDTAGYANLRRFLQRERRLPPRDAVKIEEMVNYFPYSYAGPTGDVPFAVNTEISSAPWKDSHRLVRVALQGRRMDTARLPPSNLVFLLDVSGSMETPDKLPLLKNALALLVNEMRAKDRVAIVVYAGAAGMVLPSTSGAHKDQILAALSQLQAGGSTAGAAGIELAYKVAHDNFIRGGNNRVILATDGDFNVGTSSDAELVRLIEAKREQGVFLTVLGFGTGNYQDAKMEKLADKGNGNHAYIDTLSEARKVLVSEMGGTLFTIAKDVKLQIEFNPAKVKAYRLIGYENRMLAARDFNDDKKDAGELGAGHSVTAFYEVIPAGSTEKVPDVDALKYQKVQTTTAAGSDELMTVKLRYKAPAGDKSKLITQTVADQPERLGQTSIDFRFATSVVELGLLLRKSEHKGAASYARLIERARGALGKDPGGYRHAFLDLARDAAKLASPATAIAH